MSERFYLDSQALDRAEANLKTLWDHNRHQLGMSEEQLLEGLIAAVIGICGAAKEIIAELDVLKEDTMSDPDEGTSTE